jgi:hypothetical protein
MRKFILRYQKAGRIPKAAKERISRIKGVYILDESPHLLLVEGPETELKAALKESDWSINPEAEVGIPENRKPGKARA